MEKRKIEFNWKIYQTSKSRIHYPSQLDWFCFKTMKQTIKPNCALKLKTNPTEENLRVKLLFFLSLFLIVIISYSSMSSECKINNQRDKISLKKGKKYKFFDEINQVYLAMRMFIK